MFAHLADFPVSRPVSSPRRTLPTWALLLMPGCNAAYYIVGRKPVQMQSETTYQLNIITMLVYKSNAGTVTQIRSNHFKVTMFTPLGHCTFEMRHATKDQAIYELNK